MTTCYNAWALLHKGRFRRPPLSRRVAVTVQLSGEHVGTKPTKH